MTMIQANVVPQVGAGLSVQQVQTSYSTAMAVQVPRSLAAVRDMIKEEALLAGESFYYGWAAGGDQIEGPSIKCATAMARCWGNCAVELQPMQDTPKAWVFTASFIDLQTGFTMSRQFRQSKGSEVYGRLDDERKDDIRFQIGQSKAIRNVILNALPEALSEDAVRLAKKGGRRKMEEYVSENGIEAARRMIFKMLAKVGVTEEQALRKVSLRNSSDITIGDLLILRSSQAAISDGQDSVESLFGKKDDEDAKPATKLSEVTTKIKEKTEEEPEEDPEKDKKINLIMSLKPRLSKEGYVAFCEEHGGTRITRSNLRQLPLSELDHLMGRMSDAVLTEASERDSEKPEDAPDEE